MSKKFPKALVIDSSGLRPWLFSIDDEDISLDTLENFIRELKIDLRVSPRALHEFSSRTYGLQTSLFANPLTVSREEVKNNSLYLSNVGYVSSTVTWGLSVQLSPTLFDLEKNQAAIWETSREWRRISEADRNIIVTARELGLQYSSVAILTNDWDLRQQCSRYELIEARGTCSMLAGLVLGEFISYQRGTYIFGKWLVEEPRWIPTVHPERKKFTFREILDEERRRQSKGKSFWSLPAQHSKNESLGELSARAGGDIIVL